MGILSLSKQGGISSMKQEKTLDELIEIAIQALQEARYAIGSIGLFERIFRRLQKLAKARKEVYYDPGLGQAFVDDSCYENSQEYCHSRYLYHTRCIQFIESYIKDGQVDLTVQRRMPRLPLKSIEFNDAKDRFEEAMQSRGFKANTKDAYRRLVHYFLLYLEDKGYCAFSQINNGDVVLFISFICTEHYYQPASLKSHLSGLRMFLRMTEEISRLEIELPDRLPQKREILDFYTDEEYERIYKYLEESDISLRNRAICLIALETGLRAVDICKLKIQDIDWKNEFIHVVQEKTGRTLNVPLNASYGNALADYLLSERPNTDSEYVFLQSLAPFNSLSSHSGYRSVLFKAITGAGIEANGRSFGTRITRHSTASKMLRQGVPLPVISEALGHGNPNSVMVYLTTEGAKLAECTLPLPGRGDNYANA